ncbi:CAP domain-containing protein [Legionella sp. km772]|uniref:CAP domain-containing protein n=1 Tax=Legionella sp. km772 TaxID=2498111 RepID=UPI000F8DA379|nr:CAP domain-containing protein [Legionella sp. km772]RUR13273.1 CAP domain-containing protein [Legionella sp. km772]
MFNFQKTALIFSFLLTAISIYAQTPVKKIADDKVIENAILVEVNAYRKKHHLAPLKMEQHISNQAKIHASKMASHQTPFGHKNFYKRVATLRKEVTNAGAAAENVAFNYKDAQDVVKNWMLSPGHERNILGNYNLTGVGIARDARGKMYFTQIFVKTGAPQQQTTRYALRARHFPQLSFSSIFKRTTS